MNKKRVVAIRMTLAGIILSIIWSVLFIDFLEGDDGIGAQVFAMIPLLILIALAIVGVCRFVKSYAKPAHLLRCHLCDHEISSTTKKCPNCGHKR